MTPEYNHFLFEVSWEVCNKVGGIYTVITSKLPEATKVYGEKYFVLGPDLKTNAEFEETDEDIWSEIREAVAIKEIPCRFGRWNVPGRPKAILVRFGEKYNKDQLLFQLWECCGVDSIAGGWDYLEPVMFSYAASEVIETVHNILARPGEMKSVAQFHEWMTGAGLLRLKKQFPEIATVFTTHATMLGRTLSSSGTNIYSSMEKISPQQEASAHNITAKCSMESASAREADCFTTVSEITALEAKSFLGRAPDLITPNGLDIAAIPDLTMDNSPAIDSRNKLLAAAGRFLNRKLPDDTKIFFTSGRGEFHNKGIDVLLSALGQLNRELEENKTVLVFISVLGAYTDLIPSLKNDGIKPDPNNPPVSTHRMQNESSDPILQTCERFGLRNFPQNRVQVIYVPVYLNGHDGLLNMSYYNVLSGCDLSIFASNYEPWGYTPLESAAYAVPTITTNQAGFGLWAEQFGAENKGIVVIKRMGKPDEAVEANLNKLLKKVVSMTVEEWREIRVSARSVAARATWKDFYHSYLKSYSFAIAAADNRKTQLDSEDLKEAATHMFAGTSSVLPHFRTFTAVANLPENISRLRELAYNLWWSWNPHALELFSALDPKLWEEMGNNPVLMLETVSPERLLDASENMSYINLYAHILKQFDDYMDDKDVHPLIEPSEGLKRLSPIAYFSAEYGLHESLPIYSGGLGTLSGDHLKTSSDLNIPLVGVGLLYKSGFFKQIIDKNGLQKEEFPENDFSSMPLEIVQDDRGNAVQISMEFPGRTLFANIWQIHVGRVQLYLLDTDTLRNTPQDRKITERLYCSDPRIRIEQEILLGAGGVKLLKKLGIRPRVYHINEGHSAFLIFERIGMLMAEEKLSFHEAMEVVRGSVVFTTHTPVEAGNERFNQELMEHYFTAFMKRTGITWQQFWQLGRREGTEGKQFFMTVLALNMANKSNAVSMLHGEVSRRMWRDVWKGFDGSDIPITHVTNGAHFLSYISPRMKSLFNTFVGMDWEKHLTDQERWDRVQDIPGNVLWRTRYEMRQKLVDFLRDEIARNWSKYGYSKTWQEDLFSKLNSATLTIGFARRFAPYKRADLILSDLDRLDRILNHPTRPVQIVFSGKAHPMDDMGKDLIKKVISVCKDLRFQGRIFFVEGYGINVARQLLQGVDVWLNNPRRPLEASGTSGEKVVPNGVLNFSISDGWWVEGFDGSNGWTIGNVVKKYREETGNPDQEDGESLYTLLENTVVPMFYEREITGLPERWLAMIKRSMQTLIPRFNTDRMLADYYHDLYLPSALREHALYHDNYRIARELASWKEKLPVRFSSLRLIEVVVSGIQGDTIRVEEPLEVSVRIDPGKMTAEEIQVEMVIGRSDHGEFTGKPQCVTLEPEEKDGAGILKFSGSHKVTTNGPYTYGIRVLPHHPHLGTKQEPNLVYWG